MEFSEVLEELIKILEKNPRNERRLRKKMGVVLNLKVAHLSPKSFFRRATESYSMSLSAHKKHVVRELIKLLENNREKKAAAQEYKIWLGDEVDDKPTNIICLVSKKERDLIDEIREKCGAQSYRQLLVLLCLRESQKDQK